MNNHSIATEFAQDPGCVSRFAHEAKQLLTEASKMVRGSSSAYMEESARAGFEAGTKIFLSIHHLIAMCNELIDPDAVINIGIDKLFRWTGFIQAGLLYWTPVTDEELKRMSKKHFGFIHGTTDSDLKTENLIYVFLEDKYPHYSSGAGPLTELHSLVTAEDVNHLVETIKMQDNRIKQLEFFNSQNLQGEVYELRQKLKQLQQEVNNAFKVLGTSMPESGIEDACRQVMQAYISNRNTLDRMLERVRRINEAPRYCAYERHLSKGGVTEVMAKHGQIVNLIKYDDIRNLTAGIK